ncbi:hypothetical protein BH11CYA1_BH11CYA1_38820 [soil metagenome]
MDVITEGSINKDEPVADVINAVVAIKTCQTPILRINDNQSDLQGRILFSAGGFIVGARINVTGESGYAAVRKLLLVSDGNYAILDPMRKSTNELNQALWLSTSKLIALLPNLPEASQSILDTHPERITESAARPKTGQLDLAPIMAAVGAPKDQPLADPSIPTNIEEESRQTVGNKQASRKYNEGRWRTIKTLIQLTLTLLVVAAIMLNSETVYSVVAAGMKSCGVDTDLSKYMGGFTQGIVTKAKRDLEAKKKHSK